MLRRLDHVGISVTDLDRAIDFYRDIFGLAVVVRRSFDGDPYSTIMALPGARGEVVLLRAGNLQIELFRFDHPNPRGKDLTYSVSDCGLSHFCVDVLDIDGEFERMTSAGVRFHSPPLDFASGAKAAYARDPDGNVFELRQNPA